MPESKPVPVAVSNSDLKWVPLDEGAEICEGITPGSDYPLSSIAAGYVRCEAGFRFSWEIPYDEVLYVVDGHAEISSSAGKVSAGAGEFIYLPQGTEMEYFFEVESKVLWVSYSTSQVIEALTEINVRS